MFSPSAITGGSCTCIGVGNKIVVVFDNIAEQLLIGHVHFFSHILDAIQLIAQLLQFKGAVIVISGGATAAVWHWRRAKWLGFWSGRYKVVIAAGVAGAVKVGAAAAWRCSVSSAAWVIKMIMPAVPAVSTAATIVPRAGIDAAHLLQQLLRIIQIAGGNPLLLGCLCCLGLWRTIGHDFPELYCIFIA